MVVRKESGSLVEHLHRKAASKGIPFSGTFELTPMCNMDCKMCYVHQTTEQVYESGQRLRSVDEWLALAEVLREQGTLLLLLTGGEPLTYPGFRKLYTELKKMGFVISVNTNATLIDENTAEWFAQNPPHRINITLYGASDDTYARLCHHPSGFTKTINAIEMLQDRGLNIKLNCSVTPDNVCDLERIIEYSKQRNLILQATSYMFPPVRRNAESIGKNARFSAEECAYTEARIRFLQRGSEDLKAYYTTVEECKPLDEDICFDCEGNSVRCRAGKSAFWVTWDGRLLLCAMMDEPHFFPFVDGFEKTWNELKETAKKIRLPAECALCEAKEVCRSCAAMVYTETGTYDSKPQYRCELMRATPEACRRVLEDNIT